MDITWKCFNPLPDNLSTLSR